MSKNPKKKHKTDALLPMETTGFLDEAQGCPVTPEQIQDRMLRYSRPSCPECDAFPPVCTQKRGEYALYRCRSCGHRWEVGV